MFETYVISEIVKSYVFQGLDVRSRLCYYRDGNGKEALKNFDVLNSLGMEVGKGAVICMSPMVMPLDEKNKLIPIGVI